MCIYRKYIHKQFGKSYHTSLYTTPLIYGIIGGSLREVLLKIIENSSYIYLEAKIKTFVTNKIETNCI